MEKEWQEREWENWDENIFNNGDALPLRRELGRSLNTDTDILMNHERRVKADDVGNG